MSTTPFRLPRFYPIVDTFLLRDAPLSALVLAKVLVESGVRILQYRHKDEWRQSHFDEAKAINALCDGAGVLFVLNDRADFAKLLKSALHVGQQDLSPDAARRVIGDEVLGLSTHNREQLKLGDEQAVEYLSLGPIFDTSSKQNPDPVVGLQGLAELRKLTEKPLCAIGGITMENAPAVLAAGTDSIAVISGLLPQEPERRWEKKRIAERVERWLQIR